MIRNFSDEDKQLIYSVLLDREYLIPIFTSTYNIPETAKYYDENLFIVYNNIKKKYELHSLESYRPNEREWTTYQMSLNDQLDYRVLKKIYGSDYKRHGQKIFNNIDDFNEEMKAGYNRISSIKMRKSSDKMVDYISGRLDAY